MNKPFIWAHRGASAYAPENTMASFKKAVELHADGIELDVQLTRDNELVVIHDETLERTTNGNGWVKDHSLPQLRALDCSYRSEFPDAPRMRIPLMREVFELIRPTGLMLNIELKTSVVYYPGIEQRIVAMTHEFGMADRVLYSSFHAGTLQTLLQLDPQAKAGFLYSKPFRNMPDYARELGACALHPSVRALQDTGFADECRRRGLQINVWTVNKKEQMQLCCEAGVDGMITNFPDRAARFAREY